MEESEYDKAHAAFGRMPIVIELGDFLQLKPTGSSVSLITDPKFFEERDQDYPVEFQQAMKCFCKTPLCFELQASNRFTDQRLRDLMNFMRSPTKTVPRDIKQEWEAMQILPDDPRLQQQNFQEGHMIAIYWETVAHWMMLRAKRDAKTLQTPLILVQAADESVPHMPIDMAKKLMNKANPKDTVGMWMRF